MYEPSVVLLFLSVFLIQGRSVVRVCESLSKLHEYISSSELKLPSSTLSLEEDLKVSDMCTLFVYRCSRNLDLELGVLSLFHVYLDKFITGSTDINLCQNI